MYKLCFFYDSESLDIFLAKLKDLGKHFAVDYLEEDELNGFNYCAAVSYWDDPSKSC